MVDALKHFCPRLIDYIVVVGNANPTPDSETPLQPQILRRYPAEDHKDFILPLDTAFFCQPEGCTIIGAKHMSFRDRQSFVFALTDKDSGLRRYGTCLNFYRPFKRKYLPNKHQLSSQKSAESTSSTEGVASAAPRVKALKSHTLTTLCIISHHAFFDTFRECLNVLAKLIDVCNTASSAKPKQRGVRRMHNAVWKFLIGKLKDPLDSSSLHLIKQLETWIFRLLSAPVPVPGKCRLELHVLPSDISNPFILALPDKTRFNLVDFPLHLPLELLGVEKCIQILECIILEQKVLLMSRDYNALTMSVLALVSMLYPLDYMFPVIPLLPASMVNSEQLLYAPTPYIIGIPASFGQTRKTCLPNDVWLFDLDSDSVTAPPGPAGQLPPLPEPEGTMLRTHLKQSLASLSLSPKPIKNLDELLAEQSQEARRTLANSKSSTGLNFNPFIYGNDIDSVDVATRVAMVRFFGAPNILGNIQEHTRVLRLYPRPVVGFQLSSFIRSRPNKSLFICKLAAAQAVEFYTEWALNPTNLAFMRVQTGIYDPIQIGDKAKWYANNLQCTSYHVAPSSDMTIFHLAEHHTEAPTDESGASDDEHYYSSVASDSDTELKGNQPPAVTVQVKDVFKPPTQLPRMDTLVPSCSDSSGEEQSSSEDESEQHSFQNPHLKEDSFMDSKVAAINGNNNVIENTTDGQPSQRPSPPRPAPRRPPPLKNMKEITSSESQPPTSPAALISNLSTDIGDAAHVASSKISSFLDTLGDKISNSQVKQEASAIINQSANAASENVMPKVNQLIDSTQKETMPTPQEAALDHHPANSHQQQQMQPQQPTPVHRTSQTNHTIPADRERQFQESKNVVHGENQVFLKECVTNVLEGHGISWLKTGRFRKLMEDENYRNFVMSRLNTQLDKKLSSESDSIDDVLISKSVYKGMVVVLSAIAHGLAQTYQTSAQGGVASAHMVLEVAATHYYVRDNKSTNSSRTSSPFGSRESLISIGKEGHATPTKQLMNKRLDQQMRDIESQADSISLDEDMMRQMVKNKELLAAKQEMNLGDLDSDLRSVSSRRSSCRSPISHQPLKKLSSASDRASPTNSENSQVDWLGQLSDAINNYSQTVMQNELLRKSQLNSGYRYFGDKLVSVSNSSSAGSDNSSTRVYVFEGLIGKHRSALWDQMQFWEDTFLDGVAQERDIIGLDQEPAALMERYHLLGDYERKHLEQEEDRLLSTMLYNLTSFMVMMQVNKAEIRKKNRRLLGKSHIGLQHSQTINNLLDSLEKLNGNDIDLKPVPSRMIQKRSFSVHWGSDNTGDMLFMEVCDDCILLRSVNGVIINRWWYERLVNMTYCPKTKVLCLWRKESGQTELNKFHTKKCRDLYHCIKETMERAAARNQAKQPGPDLGGEFKAEDRSTNKSGILQVCIDGIGFLVDKTKFFVELSRIKKCFTQKGIFVLEEFDTSTGQIIQRKFLSDRADQICYAVLCVFSYMAAAQNNTHTESERVGNAIGTVKAS